MSINNWVIRSLYKQLTDGGLTLTVTGFHQNAPEKESLPAGSFQRYEFRVDGPYTKDRGGRIQRHEFEINILITKRQSNNVYDMNNSLDEIFQALNKNFCILKIDKDNTEEPFELVGTLRPYKTGRRQLAVHNFGLVETSSNLYQGVVVGRYYIDTNLVG